MSDVIHYYTINLLSASSNTPLIYIHALSPYALKLKSYLLYKQLDFDIKYVNPLKPRLPVGRTVPVMCVDEDCRNESSELGVWLDELYPNSKPLLFGDKQGILDADDWVTTRLIPAFFRVLLGHRESVISLVRNRWRASYALHTTVEGGVPLLFRVIHLLKIHKAPFIARLIESTDETLTNDQLRRQLTIEFEQQLAGGPFMDGRDQPTLADLSAYPLVVLPFIQLGKPLFLQSPTIDEWVIRMQKNIPNHSQLLPAHLRARNDFSRQH